MGVYDVADCTAGALWLCTQGLADRQRLFIAGDSSGGYTTLASLAFHPDVFAAGAAPTFFRTAIIHIRCTRILQYRYLQYLNSS